MQSANWNASVSLLPVPLPALFEDPQAVIAKAQLTAAAAMTRFRMAARRLLRRSREPGGVAALVVRGPEAAVLDENRRSGNPAVSRQLVPMPQRARDVQGVDI
jgi:hypothetical protein